MKFSNASIQLTPFHFAVKYDRFDILQDLLQHPDIEFDRRDISFANLIPFLPSFFFYNIPMMHY